MYEEVIRRHRPRGYRVRHTQRKTEYAQELQRRLKHSQTTQLDFELARAAPETRTITAPWVVDAFTLHVVLHEFGHVHLGHWTSPVAEKPQHVIEWEAEQWAIGIMKVHGIKIPRVVYKAIRCSIRSYAEQDIRRGHVIRSDIRRFARL